MRTVTRRRLSSPWPAAPRISTPSHQHLITVAITQGDGACPIRHLVGRPARAAEAELCRGAARLGFGRMVALHRRLSALYTRCVYFKKKEVRCLKR